MANGKKSMLKKGFYLMKKKYLAILVAVVGVMGAAIGGTMSYMTETEEVTNVFTVGDLDMGQNETDWELTGQTVRTYILDILLTRTRLSKIFPIQPTVKNRHMHV